MCKSRECMLLAKPGVYSTRTQMKMFGFEAITQGSLYNCTSIKLKAKEEC